MPRKIFFTPGPSEIYFTLETHLKNALRKQVPSLSHRGSAFKSIYQETTENLRTLLNLPRDYEILFTASATEVWEHVLRNCVLEETNHFVNGAFSKRFCTFSGQLGFKAINQVFEDGTCATPASWQVTPASELVGLALNESSTGVAFPVDYFQQLRSDHPDIIVAVDGVSAIPIPPLDFSLVDTAYFSVQKCFGLPAGLGVWVVGPGCIEKAKKLSSEGQLKVTYRSMLEMIDKARAYQTIETPNVLGIYLLGQVVADMLTKGIDTIRRESTYKAAVFGQMIEKLDWLSHFVKDPKIRSETVIVAHCERPTSEIVGALADRGFVIGQGYGVHKSNHLRFSNFPTHSKEQVEMLSDIISAL